LAKLQVLLFTVYTGLESGLDEDYLVAVELGADDVSQLTELQASQSAFDKLTVGRHLSTDSLEA
jgi:hypothetical protein